MAGDIDRRYHLLRDEQETIPPGDTTLDPEEERQLAIQLFNEVSPDAIGIDPVPNQPVV